MNGAPLLDVRDLKVHFPLREGWRGHVALRAVDGVSFEVAAGECAGLVGESGCGKTTLARAVLGLIRPTAGSVLFEGRDVHALRGPALRQFRRSAQLVFQDPFDSLNPRLTVGSMLREVLNLHDPAPLSAHRARMAELLRSVGLDPAYVSRYPHEFSGGQRQRIGIARALAVRPSFIVADEPVSALDVSVQVQILNLLRDLQARLNLAYLFVAHDLAVVRYMCHRVLVMYLGRIVESAPVDGLFGLPSHPYTEALLAAVPDVDKGLEARTKGRRRIVLKGDVPSPTQRIPGCPFHPRCHRAVALCRTAPPPTVEVAPGHASVCHLARPGVGLGQAGAAVLSSADDPTGTGRATV